MEKVAAVYISNSTRKFDREYHYSIPCKMENEIRPGIRVMVPFGKWDKPVEAVVFRLMELESADGLKQVKKIIDKEPVLNENMIKLALWMKYRYICTFSDAVKTMLPPGTGVKGVTLIKLTNPSAGLNQSQLNENEKMIIVLLENSNGQTELDYIKKSLKIKGFSEIVKTLQSRGIIGLTEEYGSKVREKKVRAAYLAVPKETVQQEIEKDNIKRIQHIRVLEVLMENQCVPVADLVGFAGVSPSVLNTLKKYGYIDFEMMEVKRNPYFHHVKSTLPLNPTPEQEVILEGLKKRIDEGFFYKTLIHGVTGSGKTEIYMQLIQYCIDKGTEAIVLVPEISLTPQMVNRFKGRFGKMVAVLHSRMSPGERFDQWRLIKEGDIKVAVGARSAVFAPFDRLGIIIIDEEHENSYKSELTPKYHAIEIAQERCRLQGALLVLGSATPSVESFYEAQIKQTELFTMNERTNNLEMPEMLLIDMRTELKEGNRSIFSRKLFEELKKNLRDHYQSILFLNRRGHSSFVLCRSCGYTIICPNCNVSLTYHAQNDRIICHYCGYTTKSPRSCPKCSSSYIRHFGTGTQKVEEEVRKQLPESSSIRMDMDTTTGKHSHEEILKAFLEKKIDILIGTQMIAKGHHFPNVTLVGVLAADSMLNIGDFRGSERTFQLITQVAGRAGRGIEPGRVLIQTYNTEDFSITAAVNHDYRSFYDQEIKLREKLNYPPFTNIATAVLSGINDRAVSQSCTFVKNLIQEEFLKLKVEAEVLGPSRAPLSKIKNKYRWRIVIKCRDIDGLIRALSAASDKYYDKKEASFADLSVDINPLNML